MSNTFEIGGTYFTAQGEKVYLDAITTGGKFVVSQIMRFSDYGDDFYEDVGPSKVVDKIHANAPVAVLDERFAEAQSRLDEIESQYSKRFSEVTNAEREIKDRLAKLKKYQGLELLEDFIDGKITHFVVCESEYSIDLRIKTATEAIEKGGSHDDRWDKTLKLVTLFGKSNGDLQWKVNRYYDGSGDHKQIWPCRNEDEARQTMSAIYQKMVDDHFQTATEDRPYWFITGYEKAVSAGLEQKPEVTERYRKLKKAELLKQEAAARTELEKAQAKLDALLSARSKDRSEP